MRAALCRGAVVVAAATALLVVTPASGAPDFVGVNGGEYYLNLSRLKVHPGKVTIEFVNEGEDAHNLLLQRKGGGRERTIAEDLSPGLAQEKTLRLKRGSSYRLWCSLIAPIDHDLTGMNAILRVRNH